MRFKFNQGMALDDDLDIVRKMRLEQIHCAGLTGKGMGDILPAPRVLELPFLFNNEEEKDYVTDKLFNTFETMFKEKRFIPHNEKMAKGSDRVIELFDGKIKRDGML